MRVLARNTAHRQGIPAVGRDVDLDRDVVEPEKRDRIRADGRVDSEFGQAQDPRVLVAEAQLLRRGDHSVRHMAVRLARGDRERPGQHGTGQGHDDLVADEEVAGAADDPVHGRPAIRGGLALGGDLNLAPADRLAVGLRLGLEREHLADDDGTRHLEPVHVLFFEPDAHERLEHVFGRSIRRHIDVFTQP